MPTASKIKADNYATKNDLQVFGLQMREEMRKSFKDLNDTMIQSFHFVYARFDKIDERFTKINGRFDSIAQRIDTLESGMNVRFNSVNARLDNFILDTPKKSDHNKLEKRATVLEKQRKTYEKTGK